MFYFEDCHYNSLQGLHELCLEIMQPDFIVAEIGSYAGVSADLFARYCKTLYCVDLWDLQPYEMITKAEQMFDEVWSAHDNIIPIKSTSLEAAQWFEDGELDMVYIDASHNYADVMEDIQAWAPKVKPGGWITGHDAFIEGVRQAVVESFGDYKEYPDTSWAVRVPESKKQTI